MQAFRKERSEAVDAKWTDKPTGLDPLIEIWF